MFLQSFLRLIEGNLLLLAGEHCVFRWCHQHTSTVSTGEREFSSPLARTNSYGCVPPFKYCRLCSANALRSTIFKIQEGRVIELPKSWNRNHPGLTLNFLVAWCEQQASDFSFNRARSAPQRRWVRSGPWTWHRWRPLTLGPMAGALNLAAQGQPTVRSPKVGQVAR